MFVCMWAKGEGKVKFLGEVYFSYLLGGQAGTNILREQGINSFVLDFS